MGDQDQTNKNKPKRKGTTRRSLPPLSPQAEARFLRRTAVLIGLIPLWEMSQAEANWAFKQKVRLSR